MCALKIVMYTMICRTYLHTLLLFIICFASFTFAWDSARISVPPAAQEFRAAWITTVHNIDWPSKAGLPAATQRAELLKILNTCAQLRLNAIFLQVRPNADAIYRSALEPWSQWLSGPGINPGYDPLAFAIHEAHRRGIEVHAWFNPFRAKANISHKVGRGHISLTNPGWMKKSGSVLLMNPSVSSSRSHALKVIMDVVRRYDIDGVHLDDYFYPYPSPGKTWSHRSFPDGKTPAQRRAYIDDFVSDMYDAVKDAKPWVRVGISPFGIWRPGVPEGIEAGVDAYEHLACDARKWLAKGWVDYLAPQLYWRCSPEAQSFPSLMQWWAAQNTRRPVWPGIATARIKSSEDPGRPASEIAKQIRYSRSLAKSAPGQCFWSVKSIIKNADGIQSHLRKLYPTAALPPAMPWCGSNAPGAPLNFRASDSDSLVNLTWQSQGNTARKWVVQARYGSKWSTIIIIPGKQTKLSIPKKFLGSANAIAIRGISPYGAQGQAACVTR